MQHFSGHDLERYAAGGIAEIEAAPIEGLLLMLRRACSLLVLFAVALLPVFAADHLKFGQPYCPTPVLDKKYFVVCHDPEHKIPTWVGYALTSRLRKNADFRQNPQLHLCRINWRGGLTCD